MTQSNPKAAEFNPADIKALVFDLDGTLLRSDKTISERTIRAVHHCRDLGIQIIIDTGRSFDSGARFHRQLGLKGPHVYCNGADVADLSAGKVIHTSYLDSKTALYSVELAREMNIYYQLFSPDWLGEGDSPSGSFGKDFAEILVADRKTAEAETYQKVGGVTVVEKDLKDYLERVPSVKKGMYISNRDTFSKMRPLLEDHYGESASLTFSCPEYLEVMAAGVTKGSGLLHALDYLGISPGQAIAFGDAENDIPMFRAAAFSAAPANAREHIKKEAVFQIPSNNEDGIAVFLEQYFANE